MSKLKTIKDKARQAFKDQQSQDTEGGSPCAGSYIVGYLAGYRELEAENELYKTLLDKSLEANREYSHMKVNLGNDERYDIGKTARQAIQEIESELGKMGGKDE
jgi:hypothetical protein